MGGVCSKKKEEMSLRKTIAFAVVLTDSSVASSPPQLRNRSIWGNLRRRSLGNHQPTTIRFTRCVYETTCKITSRMNLWIHQQKNN